MRSQGGTTPLHPRTKAARWSAPSGGASTNPTVAEVHPGSRML